MTEEEFLVNVVFYKDAPPNSTVYLSEEVIRKLEKERFYDSETLSLINYANFFKKLVKEYLK